MWRGKKGGGGGGGRKGEGEEGEGKKGKGRKAQGREEGHGWKGVGRRDCVFVCMGEARREMNVCSSTISHGTLPTLSHLTPSPSALPHFSLLPASSTARRCCGGGRGKEGEMLLSPLSPLPPVVARQI